MRLVFIEYRFTKFGQDEINSMKKILSRQNPLYLAPSNSLHLLLIKKKKQHKIKS